jgi:hypothetical protein
VANRNVQLAFDLSQPPRNIWSLHVPSQRVGTRDGIIGFDDANQTKYYFTNDKIKSLVLSLLTHPNTPPFNININVDGVNMVFSKQGDQIIMQVGYESYVIFSHEP